MIKKDEEDRLSEQKAHEDKVNYLNELNADYKLELENLLSAPAKWKPHLIGYFLLNLLQLEK